MNRITGMAVGGEISREKESRRNHMAKAKNVLTPRQTRFVEEYLIDLNATQAAIRVRRRRA
jgi:hypothetical protein